MINQEIIQYIKTQMQIGVDNAKIRSDLLANSWNDTDISEAMTVLGRADMPQGLTIPVTQISQNTNKSNTGIIVLVLAIVLLLVGGSSYSFLKNKQTAIITSDQSFITTVKINEDLKLHEIASSTSPQTAGSDGSMHIEADIVQTTNCGSADCFNQKFLTCSPATLELKADLLGSFYYEIIKQVPSGCQVTMKYTKYPDPEWVNKPMTCTLDNRENFTEEVQRVMMNVLNDPKTCTGALADILRNWSGGDGMFMQSKAKDTDISSELNTDISTWEKENFDIYQTRWPRNLVTIIKSYGAESISLIGTAHPSATSSDEYVNCNGQFRVALSGEDQERKLITINTEPYCLVIVKSFNTIYYKYIKKIELMYVSNSYSVGYLNSDIRKQSEPKIIALLNIMAGTLKVR